MKSNLMFSSDPSLKERQEEFINAAYSIVHLWEDIQDDAGSGAIAAWVGAVQRMKEACDGV